MTQRHKDTQILFKSLAGISDEIQAHALRGDDQPQLVMPQSAQPADSVSPVEPEEEGLEDLLRTMVHRLQSNEQSQERLTEQFLKQNLVIGETLQYLNGELDGISRTEHGQQTKIGSQLKHFHDFLHAEQDKLETQVLTSERRVAA